MMDLLIETSGEIGYLALIREKSVIAFCEIVPPKRQSQELLPQLSTLFQKNHVTLEEVQNILIGIGPGAFTGTRIGAMVAKTLSFTHNIPLIPFCSLEGSLHEESGAVITDAKAGYLYLLQADEPELITPNNLPQNLPLYTPDPLLAQKHNLNLQPFSPQTVALRASSKKKITWKELKLPYLRKI
ncbi:MAG: tRNA (adenosine(37)-N6)-threonylcarbamoyltransferase complex dimerization subunit type 1 TsaB [Candidatus Algichlamydia australiensis]|nr:tRNA (adenosine(37)-N6)-threonylcarbamoyltransferase complex dimerization subunit type 1 TsaB [Chlamydiales bacterium]